MFNWNKGQPYLLEAGKLAGLGYCEAYGKRNATGLEIYENKEMFVEMCLEER